METEKLIDTAAELEMAMASAKLGGQAHLFVSEEILNQICQKARIKPVKSILLEGVRLYTSQASKEELDASESKLVS